MPQDRTTAGGGSAVWQSPVKRGAVHGVNGAAAGREAELSRSPQGHTLTIGGCCSHRLAGEGTFEYQTPLGAHQEGVWVPGGKGQGCDPYAATTSCLRKTRV